MTVTTSTTMPASTTSRSRARFAWVPFASAARRSAALLAGVLCLAAACTDTTDLCTKDTPNADCEQCRTLPRAKECPQCQGAKPEPGCENAADAGGDGGAGGASGTGGTGGILPLVDGGNPLTGGTGASDTDGGGGTGGADGGPDATMDAGPCAQGCSGTTPHCLLATDTCVECRKHADCDGTKPVCDPDAHECVECLAHTDCDGSKPRCDEAAHTCVECLAHADCDDATAAKCATATHTCVACTASSQCTHVAGKTVCDASDGECVECTGDTEVDKCGLFSCRGSDHSCTTTLRGSLDVCDPCSADSECMTGERCVLDTFNSSDVGTFCFLIATDMCASSDALKRPYRLNTSVTSIDGVEDDYCMPPSGTTCQGIQDTQSKACSVDTDCGEASMADGYCPSSGTGAGFCSYLCGGDLDCRNTLVCSGTTAHCRPP